MSNQPLTALEQFLEVACGVCLKRKSGGPGSCHCGKPAPFGYYWLGQRYGHPVYLEGVRPLPGVRGTAGIANIVDSRARTVRTAIVGSRMEGVTGQEVRYAIPVLYLGTSISYPGRQKVTPTTARIGMACDPQLASVDPRISPGGWSLESSGRYPLADAPWRVVGGDGTFYPDPTFERLHTEIPRKLQLSRIPSTRCAVPGHPDYAPYGPPPYTKRKKKK